MRYLFQLNSSKLRIYSSNLCSILLTTAVCGRLPVIRTIIIGSCVSVQGIFVRSLQDGRIVIRADNREFSGFPIAKSA